MINLPILFLAVAAAVTPASNTEAVVYDTPAHAHGAAAAAASTEAADAGLGERLLGVAHRVGITPHALFSQIVVFCIVAWCLKRFAFDPILGVLDERRKRIAESLENAERIKHELAQAEATRKQMLADANAQAAAMIAEAQKAAVTQGEKRLQDAVVQAELVLRKAQEASKLEREQMMAELKREVARLVVDATSKVTGKALNADDQRRLREEAVTLVG